MFTPAVDGDPLPEASGYYMGGQYYPANGSLVDLGSNFFSGTGVYDHTYVTVYPVFENQGYAVPYYPQNGDEESVVVFDKNNRAMFNGIPKDYPTWSTGAYKCVRYNTQANGSGYDKRYDSSLAKGDAVYAIWEYDVEYHYKDESGGDAGRTQTYVKGVAREPYREATARKGYHVSGWRAGSAPANKDDVGYTITRNPQGSATGCTPALTGNPLGETATSPTVNFYAWEQPNQYTVYLHRGTVDAASSKPSDIGEGTDDKDNSETFTYDSSEGAFPENPFDNFGHHFVYWNTKADNSGTLIAAGDDVVEVPGKTPLAKPFNLTAAYNGVVHVYAQWEADQYTITFDSGGKFGTMGNQSVTYDTTGTLTANAFSNAGYDFANWKVTGGPKNGQTVTNQSAYGVLCPGHNGTVTLTAQWSAAKTYGITYVGKLRKVDGSAYDGETTDKRWWADERDGAWVNKEGFPASYTVKSYPKTAGDGAATGGLALQNPERAGWEFLGWTVKVADGGKLSAAWTVGEGDSAPQATGTAVTDPTRDLVIYSGNGTNGDGVTGTYGALTLTAHWKAVEHTIAYRSNFGKFGNYSPEQLEFAGEAAGGITPSAAPTVFEVKADQTYPLAIAFAPKRANWYAASTFVGWRVTAAGGAEDGSDISRWVTGEGTPSVTVQVGQDAFSGDLVLTAIWKHVQVSIEAPITVNFCASSASDAYDTNNPNERVWLENKAVFKSYRGEGTGSSHDFAIAQVECIDVSDTARMGDYKSTNPPTDAASIYSTGSDTAVERPVGAQDILVKSGDEENDVAAADAEMFWIANKSTVAANGGDGSSESIKKSRHYFGYGKSSINTLRAADGQLGEGQGDLMVYMDAEDGTESENKSKTEGAGEGATTLEWCETTLYYGLDLSKCRVGTRNAAVTKALDENPYFDFELVRLVFTFAPVAD